MRRTDWYRTLVSVHGRLGRALYRDGRALPPVQLFFEATARCDQRCRFCFYRGALHAPDAAAAAELPADAILDVVARLPSARLVSFSGGEPLLRADMLELLGRVGVSRGVSLETNGGHIDADTARGLCALAARTLVGPGLLGVDVSLHGRPETHDWLARRAGAFDRATAGLERLLEARRAAGTRFPLVTLKLVLSATNLEDLPWVHDLAARRGVDHLAIKLLDPGRTALHLQGGNSPLRGTGRRLDPGVDPDRLRALLIDALRPRGRPEVFLIPLSASVDDAVAHYQGRLDPRARDCLNLWSRLSVLPSGEYYLCKIFGAGSVHELGPLQVWNSEPFRAFRRNLLEQGPPADCVGCCYLE